jgi:transposase
MSSETTALPDDVEQLQQLVTAQRVELEHLKLVIAKLRRMQFGRSSEKLDRQIAQRELQLEELEISQDRIVATLQTAKPEPAAPRRQPLPEHLPRERARVLTNVQLSRLWRGDAPDWRGCLRDARARA